MGIGSGRTSGRRTCALLLLVLSVLLLGKTRAIHALPGDADSDGMPDTWETFFGLNPNSAADATADPDGDGLTNLQEFLTKGHPFGTFKRYFAEGSTDFFNTSIGLVNLSTTATAHIQLAFLTETGTVTAHQVTLAAGQRQTVDVDAVLAPFSGAIGTIVESDVRIAADRLMKWGATGYGSTVDTGVAAPATTWYLAEGASALFQTYYLLLNPNVVSATVTVKFLRELGGPITKTYAVGARRRATILTNTADVGLLINSYGAVITSDVPIVAERSMYFGFFPPMNAGTGGSAVPATATQWTFAESSTGPFFDEFVSLVNPSTTQTATATLTFHLSGGSTLSKSFTVAPERRRTVALNLEAMIDPTLAPLVNATFWMTVDSTQPIAAERSMWWPHNSIWYEGHAGHGSTTPGTSWVVPEGTNGGAANDKTYLLIANTSASAGQVRLKLIQDGGATATHTLAIGALQRLSIDVGAEFTLAAARFSVIVESLGAPGVPIVVDYARYSSPGGVQFAAGGATVAIEGPPVDEAPTATATTPANGATNVAVGSNITVTFSEPVNVTGSAFTLECPTGTSIAFTNTTASPATTFTLDPNVNLPFATTCTVKVVATDVTDADGNDPPDNMAADYTFSFTTVPCPTITVSPATLPTGTTGTPYPATQFTQAGGTAPETWSVTLGALPPGLTLTTAGLLSGTPTDDGSFGFTIGVSDVNGCSGSRAYTVQINCPTITVTTTGPVPNGQIGTAYPGVTFQQTGGTLPITWSVTAGTLPAGLTLSPSGGTITGTPTQSGSFTVTVTATDANGCTGSLQITIQVTCPTIAVLPAGPTLPDGLFGTAYSQTFTASGGAGPFTFTSTGTLPPGTTLATNGNLTGTLTNTGTFAFTVIATGQSSCSGQTSYSVTVRPDAQNETFNGAVGNTEFIVDPTPPATLTPTVVIAGTVLANDQGPGTLTAGPSGIVTTNGGAVTLAADGTFLYRPAVGFIGPSDTFQYTLTDGNGLTDTATVTLGVSGIVWYVSAGGPNGDGRSHSPFNNLTNANTSSLAGHHVFVHTGVGTTPGDITLEPGQVLHGQGSTYSNGLLTIAPVAHPTLSDTVTLGNNTIVNSLTISSGTDPALTATGVSGAIALSGVNVTAASTGLSLNNVTGPVTVTGGAFSGVTGDDLFINQGTAGVAFGSTITNAAGRSVHIQNRTAGTVTLSGAIADTASGVELASNTGSTIAFTGGMTLSTGTTEAFRATGGGTVTASGVNTLTTTTATALRVQATTIGAGGLTFQSITSIGGSSPGIVLDGTGASGGLTVTGTGTAASGGTIANKTGADGSTTTGIGVSLTNTSNVSLARMQINDHQNFAIRGTSVTGFSLSDSTINGANGTSAALDEGSVFFTNLLGSASVSNTAISGGLEDNVRLMNSTGTLNRITFSNVTIGANSVTDGNDGIIAEASSTAVMNITVQNSAFTSARGDLFQLNLLGQSSSDLVFTGNALSNNHPAIATGGGGVSIGGGDDTTLAGVTLTFDISNNSFRDANGHAVLIVKSTDPGTFTGSVVNNDIGVAAIANSGSVAGSGLKLQTAGKGTIAASILNNQIRQYNNFGIELLTGGGATPQSGTFNVEVTGNTVSNPGTSGFAMNGIHLNGGTIPGDTFAICSEIGGAGALANAITGSGANGGTDFRLRQRQATTVRLPGYAGANNDNTAAVTFVAGQNGGASGLASNTVPTGGGFIGGASCIP